MVHHVMTSEYKGHLYVPAGNDSNNILCQLLKNLALFCGGLRLHTSYRVQYGVPFSFELVDLSIILQMSSFDSQLLTNLHAIEKFSTLIISQRFKA